MGGTFASTVGEAVESTVHRAGIHTVGSAFVSNEGKAIGSTMVVL